VAAKVAASQEVYLEQCCKFISLISQHYNYMQ
jgi:hypothetical protein